MILTLATGISGQITPGEAIELMGRGTNMGNTLEPPTEGGWNNPPAEEYYFDAYVEAGYKTVRVPVRWDQHTGVDSPYTIDTAWLDRVEEVVEWGLSRDLFVIINAHHDNWIKENYGDEAVRARFDSIWNQVSRRFKGKPEKLFFEILNEPRTHTHNGLTQAEIDELNQRILGIIRKDHPTRIVLYSGKGWSSASDMMAAAIPDDPYIIATYHSYDPWDFAGEGNGTWGTTADRNAIRNTFAQVRSWADQNNMEVLLGEFGAMEECDYNSRMIHYATYVEGCLENNFAFAVWDDGGWYEVLQRADTAWNDMKDILLHGSPLSPDNITITAENDTSFRVGWTLRSDDHDTIYVERRTKDTDFVLIGGVPPESTSFLDTLPERDHLNYYRVIAVDDTAGDRYSYPVRRYMEPFVRTPFRGQSFRIPGAIQAEDYDRGGEGVTYHETTANNLPGAYRPYEGVDIIARNAGTYHVSNLAAAEWMEYSVDVVKAATHQVEIHLASYQGGGTFRILFPGDSTEVITVPSTGSWITTTEVTSKLQLDAGKQVMRVQVLSLPGFNLDKFVFTDATGVDQTAGTGFTIYPNPAGEILYFNSPSLHSNCTLKFFTPDGTMVKRMEDVSPQNGIDIRDLSAGLYLLLITSGKQVASSRFIKH
ncbi:MAG: cellulase family glycosylhydrolase [Bacteroidota bacterium]